MVLIKPMHGRIGQFRPGNPPSFEELQSAPLRPSGLHSDLWEIAATDLGLVNGEVYHYWFQVKDSNPYKASSDY
jgi:hypothetical protein